MKTIKTLMASITVKLFANGKDTGKTAIASEASGWTYEFTDLDRYQEGKEIAYTVEEVNVPDGYTASVEGYNITNTHTPEKPTPGKPNEPGKPKKGGELPNTGSKSNQVALVAGIALLGLGTGFLARRKKRRLSFLNGIFHEILQDSLKWKQVSMEIGTCFF